MNSEHPQDTVPPSRALLTCALLIGVCVVLAALLLYVWHGSGGNPPITAPSNIGVSEHSEEFFRFAIDNLNRLEENDATELSYSAYHQWNELGNSAGNDLDQSLKGDSLAASWVEPDMLRQIIERLNDWIEIRQPAIDWQPDPMLKSLGKDYLALPMIADLDQPRFTRYDGFMLMETTWLRDASKWAGGEKSDDLARASRLFDWTIRNIALEADDPDRPPLFPWEVLLMGKGTSTERAWVYILLLRQQGIDAGIVALPATAADGTTASGDAQTWCVAVLIGPPEAGKLYLFEPMLGVPIPAAHGIRAGAKGQLDVMPATLDEVQKDPKILDQIPDFDAGHPYWAKKADLRRAVISLEASPQYLSKRMKIIENRLSGSERMVLSTVPSVLAKRLQKAPGVSKVDLWRQPYDTIMHRMKSSPAGVIQCLMDFLPLVAVPQGWLYRGRILHIKGRFLTDAEDAKGAIEYYYLAHPTTTDLVGEVREQAQYNFKQYFEPRIASLPPEQRAAAQRQAALEISAQAKIEGTLRMDAKLDAGYWIGLISYERRNYPSAEHWLKELTTDESGQLRQPMLIGGHYNLARCYEAQGDRKKAITEYQDSIFSELAYANKVRAVWLKQIGDTAR